MGTLSRWAADSTIAGGTGDVLSMANGGNFQLVSVALAALGGDTGYGINIFNNVANQGLQYGVYNRHAADYAGTADDVFLGQGPVGDEPIPKRDLISAGHRR